MPMGPGPVGFAAFLLVKFGGYTGAAHVLSKAYSLPSNSVRIGAARTAIGIGAGLAYFSAWSVAKSEPNLLIWFIGLLPVRILEWGILLRLYFDKKMFESERSWRYSFFGTLWSFALDAIGVGAAFVIPGGMWVC